MPKWIFQNISGDQQGVRGEHCRHPIAVMGVVDTFRRFVIPAGRVSQSLQISKLLHEIHSIILTHQRINSTTEIQKKDQGQNPFSPFMAFQRHSMLSFFLLLL